MTDPKLPDDVRVEWFHGEEHRMTKRVLRLDTPNPDPRIGSPRMGLTVNGTLDTRNGDLQMPVLGLMQISFTRKQWEAVKQLGDLAWAEFDRRVST